MNINSEMKKHSATKSGAKITRSEISVAVSLAGGATLTKKARKSTLKPMFEILREVCNIQIRSLKHLKAKHIHLYIACRLNNEGIDLRTAQNNMSHIRESLRAIGRTNLADSEEIGCKALKIDGASRNGTHSIPPEDFVKEALAIVMQADKGASCCLKLQRTLGLRAQEAVQSGPSLKSWLFALLNGRPCKIIHGTKGGRSRDLAPMNMELAITAIREAIEVFENLDGYLVLSKSLKGAMYKYWRICSVAGLKGKFGSHSFRCAYALDRYKFHYENSQSVSEALAATSIDLGHGDGRGRYVRQVYLYSYF